MLIHCYNSSFYLDLLDCLCSYNPAVPMPPVGWAVSARPQPWYPQHPGVSVPPPAPLGLPPQPLFPVQNMRPPMPSTAPPGLQPLLPITPPGLPASTAPVPVSQPLFPVVPGNIIPPQSSAFVASMPSPSLPLGSSLDPKGSADSYLGNSSSTMIGSYPTSGIPGTS